VGGEEAYIPREFLYLEGKSFSSGSWHASLGEGLACTSMQLQHLEVQYCIGRRFVQYGFVEVVQIFLLGLQLQPCTKIDAEFKHIFLGSYSVANKSIQ
jgi:hypothetical protein